jgi:tRNA (guanine26-N2/guanine27-N2)-dimethyltransferase
MELRVKRIIEGKTILYVPDTSIHGPWAAPVFYNPKAALTRDISLAAVNALGGEPTVLDAMCGVGARGLRLAVESNASAVVLNDVNPDSLRLAYLSAKENKVIDRVHLESAGANGLCASYEGRRGFDYVDVDPFGSAAPFVASALLAVKRGGMLGVCSTDAANLCGNRPHALRRIYFAHNEYRLGVKEAGLRILISYVVRVAASMGYASEPTLCYYYGDYFRCHFKVTRAPSVAERLLGQVGYLHRCVGGWTYTPTACCGQCGGTSVAGPLWTGPLCSKQYLGSVITALQRMDSEGAGRARDLLSVLLLEDQIVLPYVNLHVLVRGSATSPPSTQRLVFMLRQLGYRASPTHFDPKAIKTDAPQAKILECAASLSNKTA